MSTAITTIAPSANAALSITEGRRTVQQLVAQRGAIVEAMTTVMRKDIDFGTIPGTPKPTLYKPGSEKILSMFNLSATPTVEDLSTPDTIRYRVHVSIQHIPSGNVLGVGVGEASSAESKYQWRAAVCNEEWDETPEDRRRNKWKKGNGGAYAVRQIRADMEDIANTVLKMAKKRAQIDAVLTVTAASDVFAQDIEDLVAAGLDPATDFNPDADPSTQSQPRHEDLQRRETAQPQTQQRQQPTQQASQGGGPVISEAQGKRWWAVAMGTHQDHKVLMAYLRERIGVGSKNEIPQSRYDEVMLWAEGKAH